MEIGAFLFMDQILNNPATEIKQDRMLCYAWRIANGEAGEYIYCLEDGKFYIYENGVWQTIFDIDFLGRVSAQIKEITKYGISIRKQILENFKIIKNIRLSNFNQMSLINFENYMFDPVGINVLLHKKEFYSSIRIPYKYDDKAQCELWVKTLKDIFEDDQEKIELLQEFFGNCLTRNTTLEKALLLLGESRSGKSTILNTLQYMVGDANCSHVPLMHLENPQYTSMMLQKLVNIDGEVSKKAEDFESQFKTIVTGHEVNCNDKYMPPFKFRPFCKFVMSANEFPKITDHSSAFYKRLILIPCNRVFEPHEQNRNLREELLKELPGILNWAIQGLKKLNLRGQFEEKQFLINAIQELEDENNPVNIFFKERIEKCFDEEIEKGFLYDKYKEWCFETKNYTLNKARFAACIYKKYHKETPKDTQNLSTRKRIWRNIKYIDIKSLPNQTDIGWQQ